MSSIRKIIKKNRFLYETLKRVQVSFRRMRASFFQLIFFMVPIDNKKIVVCNYYGQGYGDNAKCVIDELLKINKDCKVFWLVNNFDYELPDGIKMIKYGSLKALFHLSTAKIWIDNCRKEKIFLKRKKQYYIQLWHGSIPLKMVEKDAFDTLAYDYVLRAKRDSYLADLFVSGSDYATDLYRNSFWYKGEILEKGTPKDDILYKKEKHKEIDMKVRKELNIPDGKKIVLYAPTFREDHRMECYDINYDLLKKSLYKKFKEEYIIIVRMHPILMNLDNKLSFPNDVIDVTKYPNLNELMIASDILITDYSSIMFPFSFMMKKTFLFCTDIEQYKKKDRNFYFDIKKLPFLMIESNEELDNKIMQFDEEKYKKDIIYFKKSLNIKETGNSSAEIAKIINMKISESE